MEHSGLVNDVIGWNKKFPIDRWWRNKHGVSFLSAAHREASFLSQIFEYEEDKLFLSVFDEIKNDKKGANKYVPNVGDIFKESTTLEDFSVEAEDEIRKMIELEENANK